MFDSTVRNQINSSLLRLPAEIRNVVYGFATEEACIHLSSIYPESYAAIATMCAYFRAVVRLARRLELSQTPLRRFSLQDLTIGVRDTS